MAGISLSTSLVNDNWTHSSIICTRRYQQNVISKVSLYIFLPDFEIVSKPGVIKFLRERRTDDTTGTGMSFCRVSGGAESLDGTKLLNTRVKQISRTRLRSWRIDDARGLTDDERITAVDSE